MEVTLVEIIRYGNPELGVQVFGIFSDMSEEDIHKMMDNYNQLRGGKYPAYYMRHYTLNKKESLGRKKIRKDIE